MTAQHDPDWAGVLSPPRVTRPSEMSPVNRMLDAADQITARTLAIEEIRAVHPRYPSGNGQTYCDGCGTEWPCPTAAILEKHGLLS